jgi:hypothetical protein
MDSHMAVAEVYEWFHLQKHMVQVARSLRHNISVVLSIFTNCYVYCFEFSHCCPQPDEECGCSLDSIRGVVM